MNYAKYESEILSDKKGTNCVCCLKFFSSSNYSIIPFPSCLRISTMNLLKPLGYTVVGQVN